MSHSEPRNVKKVRPLSAVCGLARSWQQWVSENQEKQASEPSGWAPSESEDTKPSTAGGPHKQAPPPTHPVPAKDTARIRSKQVVKCVSSGAQERGAGVGLLTELYGRDQAEQDKDVERLLKGRGSPTRRRKCCSLVSQLTQSWKQVEREAGRDGSVETEDSGFSEADERTWDGSSESGAATEMRQDVPEAKLGPAESAPRIRRCITTTVNRDTEEARKHGKKLSRVGSLKSKWQNWESEHTINQKLNPFSDEFDYELSMSTRLHRGQEGYGRPKEGSKTAERAKRAEAHIHREIDDMCFIIRTMTERDADGRTRVTFGELFDRYVRISDKVVGILMRARKHGKVAFEGEMLWQGQDDHVVITLLV